jgi:hypothetical protein
MSPNEINDVGPIINSFKSPIGNKSDGHGFAPSDGYFV